PGAAANFGGGELEIVAGGFERADHAVDLAAVGDDDRTRAGGEVLRVCGGLLYVIERGLRAVHGGVDLRYEGINLVEKRGELLLDVGGSGVDVGHGAADVRLGVADEIADLGHRLGGGVAGAFEGGEC